MAGRLRTRLMRLRQPKYLGGAVVGAAYIYFLFLRRLAVHPASPHPDGPLPAPDLPPGALPPGTLVLGAPLPPGLFPGWTAIGAAVFLLMVLLSWVLPRAGGASLSFNEAEIAFLFPAPVARRTLVHYRVLSQLLGLLLASTLFALFSNRWSWTAGSAASHLVGWWFILTTLTLHGTAAAFVISHLHSRGIPGWVTRLAVVGAAVATVAVTVLLQGHLERLLPATLPADYAGGAAYFAQLLAVLNHAPLSWVLAAGGLVVAPFMAADLSALMWAVPAALAVVVLHYLWVLQVAVGFEEASIARAERRARARALRSGSRASLAPAKARTARFALGSRGRPEIAFLWKNLLATPPLFSLRTAQVTAVIIVAACLFIASQPQYRLILPAVSVFAIIVAFYTVFLGPQFARIDLRADLSNADLLKSYPLRGWQVVLGEMLAPFVILTVLEWLALLAWAMAQQGQGEHAWLGGEARAGIVAGLALLLPALCALQLVMPNAVAVLLPAWSQSSRTEQGFEVAGQRVIFLLLQLLVTMLFLLPAAIGAALAYFITAWLASPVAAALAAGAVALVVLVTELSAAIFWLGGRFERIDILSEVRP